MSDVDDVDRLPKQYQLALGECPKGNPEPYKTMFSHREDVTLANPYGPPVRGWEQVAKPVAHAASLRSDCEVVGSEIVAKYAAPDLAYVVQIQRAEVGGRGDITPYAVRATMIFRPEDGVWKVVHRYADSITTVQQADSVLRE